MQRFTSRLLSAAGAGTAVPPSAAFSGSGISAGSSSAARDTLNMAGATTGFYGAALGVGTTEEPAPGDLRHASGVDAMPDSIIETARAMAAKGTLSASVPAPSSPPIDESKRAEALTEAQRRAAPSLAGKKNGFVVDRALFVNPPSTAAFLPDGRPNPKAALMALAKSGGGGGGGFLAGGDGSAKGADGGGSTNALMARRWSREANETCVEHTIRTRKHLTDYIVTYRWDDSHWRPILSLPAGNPIALEMRARHCNFALKHIAQKGHAAYNIQHVQHSILRPEGVAERAYVETSTPKGDRLLTNIIHEGVLNPKDIGNINAPRGVIAISQVQGYANAFQRKPNLWQRSRRIGALQSEMGAIEWELHGPQEVGRTDAGHVMLLSPHTRFVGGGLSTLAIVSSLQIAQHPFHYVGEFEAPATTVVDALHQAAHLLARKNKLIKTDGSERLHLLGSLARTDYPFSPVELDLHFKIQLGVPTVMRHREEYPSSLIGSPLLDGGNVFMCEFQVTQGVSNYVYDDMPSAMPHKWWHQKNAAPYVGNLYFCRTGQLKNMQLFEEIDNPFDRVNAAGGGRKRGNRRVSAVASASGGAAEAGGSSSEPLSAAEAAAEAFQRTVTSHLPDEELLATSDSVSSVVKRHYDSIRAADVSAAVPPNDRARARMRRMAKALNRHKGGGAEGANSPPNEGA